MSAQPKYCPKCHGPMETTEIAHRLRFLAYVVMWFHGMDSPLNDEESQGFMYLLQDIADMIDPPEPE